MEEKKQIQKERKNQYKRTGFSLPPHAKTNDIAIQYLKSRGIDEEIILYCIEHGMIYESAYRPLIRNQQTGEFFESKKEYHNVVFVGKKPDGNAGFASWRSTKINSPKSPNKGIIQGSRKEYSFRIVGDKSNPNVHVFKSEIELLSYATLLKRRGRDWKKQNFLTIGGKYTPDLKAPKLPIAMKSYFADHPTVKEDPLLRTIADEIHKDTPEKTRERVVYLYFDTSDLGVLSSEIITMILKNTTQYTVMNITKGMKLQTIDFNEFLLNEIKKENGIS